jgi:hypothetical protein
MGLVGNVTWINQNMTIPSVVASDMVAREVVSKEVQKVINEEKELKVSKVKPVEEVEHILKEDDSKEEIESEIRHIDLKA